jgi:hypothetical protein
LALSTIIRRRKEGVGGSVVELINSALREDRRKHPLREDDWIRASSIGGMCPREEVLCAKHGVVREDVVEGPAGLNFEMGNAVHWLFQNRALAPTGKIIGSWRCTYCGEVYGSRATKLVPRPDLCVRCGAIADDPPRSGGRPNLDVSGQAFLYVEEWIGNEEFKIGGSPDGQMVFGDTSSYRIEDITLLEFKSTNERNYVKYKDAPDFMHVIQAQIYLWLTGYKRAKIIYLNKNGRGTDGISEHDIDFDPEVIEKVKSAIREIRDGIASGQAPPRVICATSTCPRAMACQVRHLCFAE